MARVYQSVCNEIDNLLVKVLSLSEEFIQEKLKLEALTNDGYVNIAKARYIMGSKCVSTLQLPTENSNQALKALSTVCRKNLKTHMVFNIVLNKPSSPPTEYKEKNTDETENDHSSGLHQRRGTQLVKDEKYVEVQDELSSDSKTDLPEINEYSDPIKLFGVLVPYTLRIAQQNFKDSLFVIVKCATVQSELDAAINRYNHLFKIKILVEEAASKRGLKLYGSSSESGKLSSVSSKTTTKEESESDEIFYEGDDRENDFNGEEEEN